MHILSSIVGIIFILLLVLFSVSNLETVTISLWPFPISTTAPLFVLMLGTAAISFVLGALFVWLNDISDFFKSYFKNKALTKQLKNKAQTATKKNNIEAKEDS